MLFGFRRPRHHSPFVTQAELLKLLRKDRTDVLETLRFDADVMRRPRRAARPAPRQTSDAWQTYLAWIEEAIDGLQQPRSAAELTTLVSEWQTRRSGILIDKWGWRRRSDVIAVDA